MTKVDISKSWAYTEFITAKEQNVLLQFADSVRNLLKANGPGRYFQDHIERKYSLPHEHKDNNEKGFIHTRYNLLLSVPDSGGNPIYDGEVINVEERMLWRCEAGLYNHASLPVVGRKPRINISFGFQMKENI